jgi:hypothetical protein
VDRQPQGWQAPDSGTSPLGTAALSVWNFKSALDRLPNGQPGAGALNATVSEPIWPGGMVSDAAPTENPSVWEAL